MASVAEQLASNISLSALKSASELKKEYGSQFLL